MCFERINETIDMSKVTKEFFVFWKSIYSKLEQIYCVESTNEYIINQTIIIL